MHNVISLASSCGSGERGGASSQGFFEALLLQGFWKKLIYSMNVDEGLQVCLACADSSSYKLNYMVEKVGCDDPIVLDEAIRDPQKYRSIVKHSQNMQPWEATTLLMQYREAVTPKQFVSDLKAFLAKKDFNLKTAFLVSTLISETYNKKMANPLFTSDLGEIIKSLGMNTSCDLICTVYKLHKQLMSCNTEVQRVVYDSFGVQLLDGLEVFDCFSSNYCMVSQKRLAAMNPQLLERIRFMQDSVFKLKQNE